MHLYIIAASCALPRSCASIESLVMSVGEARARFIATPSHPANQLPPQYLSRVTFAHEARRYGAHLCSARTSQRSLACVPLSSVQKQPAPSAHPITQLALSREQQKPAEHWCEHARRRMPQRIKTAYPRAPFIKGCYYKRLNSS